MLFAAAIPVVQHILFSPLLMTALFRLRVSSTRDAQAGNLYCENIVRGLYNFTMCGGLFCCGGRDERMTK